MKKNEILPSCPGYIISPTGEIKVVPEDKHHSEIFSDIISSLVGYYEVYSTYSGIITLVNDYNHAIYTGLRLDDTEECIGLACIFIKSYHELQSEQFETLCYLSQKAIEEEICLKIHVGNMEIDYNMFVDNYNYYFGLKDKILNKTS